MESNSLWENVRRRNAPYYLMKLSLMSGTEAPCYDYLIAVTFPLSCPTKKVYSSSGYHDLVSGS